MSWLAPFLALWRAVVDFMAARQAEDARDRLRDDGAARAQGETLGTIGDIAHAQSSNDARPRDARSVGERLRDGG